MASLLSKELQKYYTRVGNKIIFANKTTLNQLAWEMWEKLGYAELDPSVLSRVINGERLFSLRQLNVFSGVLKLSNIQCQKLKNELRKDILAKYRIDSGVVISEKVLFELLDRDSKIVKSAVRGGSPLLAKQVAEASFNLIASLRNEITEEHIVNKLFRKKSEILIDYVDSLYGGVDNQALLRTARPYINEVRRIGEFLKDEKLIRNYHTLNASLFSLTSKHELTDKEVIEGYNGELLGEQATVTALKCAIVSSSAKRDFGMLGCYSKRLLKINNGLSDSFKIMAYYSLATAEATKANFSKADFYIKSAWDVYKKLDARENYKPTRRLGIAKTELHISTLNKKFRDKNYLINLCNNSIDIATATGYLRVIPQFENFLRNI